MKRSSGFPHIGVLAILLSAMMFASAPGRAEDILLDHMEFIRESGKPQAATATFPACDPFGTFTLKVENGQDGAHRASSGTISVNGQIIVSQADFNQQVALVTKPLTNILEQNIIDVLLTSAPGSVIKVTVTGEMICLNVSIDAPVSGAVFNTDEITAAGRVRHRTPEVGVSVNGVLAQVNGEDWIANNIPLGPGENVLAATVTDANGRKASSDPVLVTGPSPGTPKVALLSNVEGGIAPLTVGFSVKNDTGRTPVLYRIDFEGDGIVDFEAPSLETVRHIYPAEGIYRPEVTAVDADGNAFTATSGVNVHPLPPLKGKWDGMKAALSAGSVSAATRNFAPGSAVLYNEIFAHLAPHLPQIAVDMADIQLIYLVGDVAKYRIRREEQVDGAPAQITYYIYFVRDGEGFWKIRNF